MTTPTKIEILAKAHKLWVQDQYRNGCAELAETNPEAEEL